MDKSYSEHIQVLRKAADNRKLVVFVGSGASYPSDAPSWSGLIESMRESLNGVENDDFLKVAEHYFLEFGENSYYSKIMSMFGPMKPNPLHELLLQLAPSHIVLSLIHI